MSGRVPPRSLSELEESDALTLAATMPVGRLAHLHGEHLSVIPVNFLLEGGDVLMRTAGETELLDAARRGAPAALEVHDLVEWSRSGWSVLLRGRLSEVTDAASVERVLRWPVARLGRRGTQPRRPPRRRASDRAAHRAGPRRYDAHPALAGPHRAELSQPAQ